MKRKIVRNFSFFENINFKGHKNVTLKNQFEKTKKYEKN